MTTFLFWNIHHNPIIDNLKNLVWTYYPDVFILIECSLRPGDLLKEINNDTRAIFPPYQLVKLYNEPKDITVLSRFPEAYMTYLKGDQRLFFTKLHLPKRKEILVAIGHFPSKLHSGPYEQLRPAMDWAEAITKIENEQEHSKTIFWGDLNMNPFEPGMVMPSGFNAMSTKRLAKHNKGVRISKGKKYKTFYNPMWNFFGDHHAPPGTYYYSSGDIRWNMFDQLLIRPDLLDQFQDENLTILTNDGVNSLITANGIPDEKISDHLPLLCHLDL